MRRPAFTASSAASQPPNENPITATGPFGRRSSTCRYRWTRSYTVSKSAGRAERPKPGCDGAMISACAPRRSRNGAAGSTCWNPCRSSTGRPRPRRTTSSSISPTIIGRSFFARSESHRAKPRYLSIPGGPRAQLLLTWRAAADRPAKEMAMEPALVLSSDSHVFEPPDLWATRIDAAFRHRAPRMQRIDGADQLVVEADQVLSGIGLISNAGARFGAPRRSRRSRASRTCTGAGTTPTSTCRTCGSTAWPARCCIRRRASSTSRCRTPR